MISKWHPDWSHESEHIDAFEAAASVKINLPLSSEEMMPIKELTADDSVLGRLANRDQWDVR